MALTTWTNVARSAVHPGRAAVMAHKVYERARYGVSREAAEAVAVARREATDLDAWARDLDPALWQESLDWSQAVRAEVQPIRESLASQGIDMGGPGCFELLYFLARLRQPEAMLETGVAAGWSTRALLAAIGVNGVGQLRSSDFPFFRLRDPQRHIAYAVPDSLKAPWALYLDGDRKNLDAILADSPRFGLVHYDSDKSRGGRAYFVHRITPYLLADATLVMDDIGDNLFFARYAAGRDRTVFAYEGKHVGVISGGWGPVTSSTKGRPGEGHAGERG